MNELQNIPKEEETKIVQPQQILRPLSPEEAKRCMDEYQQYVTALIDKNDLMMIAKKEFKKKSAFRKLAMALNLSVRIVTERREDLPNNDFAYHFVCEATHPNGRITAGSGSCTAHEKAQWKDGKWAIFNKFKKTWSEATPNSLHNVRSTAETRAWNRSVSNMIAAGEVSAEEMMQEEIQNTKTYILKTEPPKGSQIQQSEVVEDTERPQWEESCTICGGAMWDNRTREDGGLGKFPKTNPKAPDWKCRDSKCSGVKWITKNNKDVAQQTPPPIDEDEVLNQEIPF